jgi:hypothetical protein
MCTICLDSVVARRKIGINKFERYWKVFLSLGILAFVWVIATKRKMAPDEFYSSEAEEHMPNTSSHISICMMLPVTSRGVAHNKLIGLRLADLPLIHTFLPSLLDTIENMYEYHLYIGYDYDDPWYDDATNRQDLFKSIDDQVKAISQKTIRLYVRPITLFGIDQRITAIWNTLASAAYRHGCDYFYPANDDLKFLTKGWTSAAIRTLEASPVAKNFGVVAFRDVSSCSYPTFHLTHRTHLEIHDGIYYPLPSHGAHQDPWIFGMYRGWNCSFFLAKYELKNHIGISVDARYPYGDSSHLARWIQRSRKVLYNRLQLLSPSVYNQSFVEPTNLDKNVQWTVPCSV